MSMIDFTPLTPRLFSDERLYPLDCEHKWIYTYCFGGLQSCAAGKTGIHRIGRGEIAVGANVDMARTESIINFFNEKYPTLLRYDNINHIIFIPSKFKYLIRYGYLKPGTSIISAIHKDFKKYGEKGNDFFCDFFLLYEKEIKESFNLISKKDKNFSYYSETFTKLMELKPKNLVTNFSAKKLKKDKQETISFCI